MIITESKKTTTLTSDITIHFPTINSRIDSWNGRKNTNFLALWLFWLSINGMDKLQESCDVHFHLDYFTLTIQFNERVYIAVSIIHDRSFAARTLFRFMMDAYECCLSTHTNKLQSKIGWFDHFWRERDAWLWLSLCAE